MKLSLDYKKLFSFIFIVLFVIVPLAFSNAETASQLRDKIEQKDNDIAKLEEEIKAYQSQLDTLGAQKDSLNKSIQELNLTGKKLSADINVTQIKIDKTSFKIESLSHDIGNKEEAIATDINSIIEGIRDTNEYEQSNILGTLLSEHDFTVVWNNVDNIATIREKLKSSIVELKQVKSDLEDTRQETIDAKNELVALKSKLADQKKIVDQNTAEKNKLLAQTKSSEANYQKLVADKQALKAAFQKELSDYESQLQYILDPKSLPSNRPLAWPLDYIYVTSPFGPRWGGFHSGTDFRAPVGTPVKAMATGVVKGVGNTDLTCKGASFGGWVFIEYTNGLSSTFGHLSLIKAVKGQKVKPGDVVAYSGNTGSSTGPHLHVTVYAPKAASVQTFPSKSCLGKTLTQPLAATNAYLDPMKYLPVYKGGSSSDNSD